MAAKDEKPRAAAAREPERIRGSREQTAAAILDAAEEMFAHRSTRDVTVRQVAEKAGVTHALVHQYFGSKNDLFNAVMQRRTHDRVEITTHSPTLDAALQKLVHEMLTNRFHTKAQIRSAMDGVEIASVKAPLETGKALIAIAEATARSGAKPIPTPRDVDPRVALAAIAAMAATLAIADSWLYPIFQIDPAEADEVNRQLGEIVTYVENLILAYEGE